MVVAQRDLRTALDQYRLTRAKGEFGSAATYHFRPGLVLPDAVLSRLVECARARKIGSVADIRRETKWPAQLVAKYGKEVFEIIQWYVVSYSVWWVASTNFILCLAVVATSHSISL